MRFSQKANGYLALLKTPELSKRANACTQLWTGWVDSKTARMDLSGVPFAPPEEDRTEAASAQDGPKKDYVLKRPLDLTWVLLFFEKVQNIKVDNKLRKISHANLVNWTRANY